MLAIHVQRQAGRLFASTGDHRQALSLVIHQTTICRGLVDLHCQRARFEAQTFHAHKGRAANIGQQTGPAAQFGAFRLQPGGLFGQHGEGKINPAHFKTSRRSRASADAGKRIDAACTQRQLVHANHAAVVKHDAVLALFKRKATGHLEEAKDIEIELATGLKQLSACACHGKVHGGFGGDHDSPGVVTGKIHDLAAASHRIGAVYRHLNTVGRQAESFHANETDTTGAGLQCTPAPLAVADVHRQHQAKVQIIQGKAQALVRVIAIDTGKCRNTAGAQGQHLYRSGLAIPGQHHAFGAALEGKPSAGLEETRHIDIKLTGDFQQLATATIHG